MRGHVFVIFQNKGNTIPAEKLSSLFDKFYRLDESRASDTGGTGLGLAIAKEIILLHGGTIHASSENDTVTFTVQLPAADSENIYPSSRFFSRNKQLNIQTCHAPVQYNDNCQERGLFCILEKEHTYERNIRPKKPGGVTNATSG